MQEQIVDIRPAASYRAGHLPHAIHITATNFPKYANQVLNLDQPITWIYDGESEADLKELWREGDRQTSIDDLNADDFIQTPTIPATDFLDLKGDYTLLDVRQAAEITRPAPEKNLYKAPLDEISQHVGQLDSNKAVYTLCGSGNRATTAASYLNHLGFEAIVIEGGAKALTEISNN